MATQVAVSAPRTITRWSLLDHQVESDAAAAGATTPWVPKPLEPKTPKAMNASVYQAISFTVDTATEDPALQKLVKKHVLDVRPELKNIRFALADLSKGGKPLFAGNNLAGPAGDTRDLRTEPTFGGSMVKIAAMLTAYQLHYDLNVLAQTHKPALTTREELFQTAWETWVATQDPAKGQPLKELAKGSALQTQGRLVKKNGAEFALAYNSWNGVHTWKRKIKGKFEDIEDGAPNLENIFNVISGSPLKVEFKQTPTPEKTGMALGEFASPSGKPFYERMYAMIHMSNNLTTASCIMDLGYLYIASTLLQTGLFSVLQGGLWLSAPYPGLGTAKLWVQNPVSQHEQVVRGKVNTSRRYQVSSALAATAFAALLGKRRLVSPHASDEMLYLMDKNKHTPGGSATRSPLIDPLMRAVKRGCSKLGLVGLSTGDCVYIERDNDKKTKTLRYAAALVDWDDVDDTIMSDLANGLDEAIEQNNP